MYVKLARRSIVMRRIVDQVPGTIPPTGLYDAAGGLERVVIVERVGT